MENLRKLLGGDREPLAIIEKALSLNFMNSLLTGPLTTERISVPIRDLPLHLHGTTLVQISDFHFDGQSLSRELLATAIAQSNAIQPDLVVLTGDFITARSHYIYELADYLQTLQSRVGTYAVLGNHDSPYPEMQRTIQRALAARDISALWNEVAYPLGHELPLVGLADFYARESRPAATLANVPDEVPRIVLAHNPDTLEQLQDCRADLVLSGHTHGGQVDLPGLGPVPRYLNEIGAAIPKDLRRVLPYFNKDCDRVFQHWEWASGLHTVGQHQLYVNRGLGTYWPGRLWCPPELTVITLLTP